MDKRTKAAMRKELDDLMGLLSDQWRSAMDFDDTDAVSLEYLAHALQGIYFNCEKAEDIAGELALAIDPNVELKV